MRLLVLLLAFFLAACEPGQPAAPGRARELVVLTRATPDPDAIEEAAGTAGFDRDLALMLGRELGLETRFITATNDTEVIERLRAGEATMAAAWLRPVADPGIVASAPYFESRDVLVTHEATLPLHQLAQLAQRQIHVVAGSRQEAALRRMSNRKHRLRIVAHRDLTEIDLLERVAAHRYEVALVSDSEFDIGTSLFPELQNALALGASRPIVWLFAPGTDPELISRANTFLTEIQGNGEFARLKDRYFGHIDRLTPADRTRFVERMHDLLPKYRPLFQDAQLATGIDWRLLAALAYQESQWNPLATSPTGVRGIMMLTEDTADEMGVDNRLNPAQSIAAGAQYLADLRNALPPEVKEPDRLWLALAAYNLGLGHLKAARYLAGTLNADANAWYSMKKVLPLLAQPKYYKRLKSGKGRGGEAVIMVENIRVYADILNRRERPLRPLDIAPRLPDGQPRLAVTRR